MNKEIIKRFWSKVDKSEDCWVWTRGRCRGGYGRFYIGKRCYLSHRFSYSISVGDIPEGMCVLHKCDNPPCVNPSHLWIGTQADNNKDCIQKGRAKYFSGYKIKMKHGTRVCYVGRKCRCARCRRANVQYEILRQKAKLG